MGRLHGRGNGRAGLFLISESKDAAAHTRHANAMRGCHSAAGGACVGGRGRLSSPLADATAAAGPNRAHCPCQTMNKVDSCHGMVREWLQPADRNGNMGGA